MTERATAWSITINNPTEQDTNVVLPAGWSLEGQFEQGAEGTHHFQGYLKTPQVRFSQVKSNFPRANIQVARNKKALQQYVHKSDSRVAPFEANVSKNIFQWQAEVAKLWNEDEFDEYWIQYPTKTQTDCALLYVDSITAKLIEKGAQGLEFIAVNPMWRSAWKRFYVSIIKRYASQVQEDGTPQEEPPSSPGQNEEQHES